MSYPNAYSNIPSPGNPRETEAWALTEAARRMSEAQRRNDGDAFLDAVRLNWRLWTIFQAEIAGDANQLPLELRQNMLSLCNFVDKTTVDIIAEPVPTKADILITVNRHLAAGLFQVPPTESQGPVDGENAAKTAGLANITT